MKRIRKTFQFSHLIRRFLGAGFLLSTVITRL
jgi:hypothetical protein